MDQTDEVQPVVTDADVGEQGNAQETSSIDTTTLLTVPSTSDAGSSSLDGMAQMSNGTQDGSTEKEGVLMRLHAALDDLETKIGNGVHVFAHEVAAVRDLVKAVI